MGDTDEYDRAKATAITFVRGGRDLQTALLKDFALDLVLVITGHDARDAQLRLDTIAAVKRLAGVRDHPEQPPGRGAEGGEPLMAADIAAGVAGNRGRAAAAAGSGSKTEPIPVSSDHEDSDDAASAPDDARAEVAAHDGQLDVHAPEVAQLLRDVARDARQARDMARDTHTLVHTLLRIVRSDNAGGSALALRLPRGRRTASSTPSPSTGGVSRGSTAPILSRQASGEAIPKRPRTEMDVDVQAAIEASRMDDD
ncbi:hypothetical protein EV715DRAFT_296996 [Schizophyllum commune]